MLGQNVAIVLVPLRMMIVDMLSTAMHIPIQIKFNTRHISYFQSLCYISEADMEEKHIFSVCAS